MTDVIGVLAMVVVLLSAAVGIGTLAIYGIVSVCVFLTVLVTLPLTAIKDATRGMRVRPLFKYFDFWVGFFWDSKSRKLYFLPLPMVGLVIQFPPKKPAPVEIDWDRALLDAGGFGKRIEPAKHAIHRVGAPCLFCDDGPKKVDPRLLQNKVTP